jgi:hypothetical protein
VVSSARGGQNECPSKQRFDRRRHEADDLAFCRSSSFAARREDDEREEDEVVEVDEVGEEVPREETLERGRLRARPTSTPRWT